MIFSEIIDKNVLSEIYNVIKNVDEASNILEIKDIKKLKGSKTAYRIRIKDYRIGIYLEENVIEFTRCLHRRDIYKYFPK